MYTILSLLKGADFMFVLFIVLNQVEHLEEVLIKLKTFGARGATIIDSMGSKRLLNKENQNISFLHSIVSALDGDSRTNKTIFSVIEREDQVDVIMEELSELLDYDGKGDKGIMFVMPVNYFRGGELERHIESRETKRSLIEEYDSEYY